MYVDLLRQKSLEVTNKSLYLFDDSVHLGSSATNIESSYCFNPSITYLLNKSGIPIVESEHLLSVASAVKPAASNLSFDHAVVIQKSQRKAETERGSGERKKDCRNARTRSQKKKAYHQPAGPRNPPSHISSRPKPAEAGPPLDGGDPRPACSRAARSVECGTSCSPHDQPACSRPAGPPCRPNGRQALGGRGERDAAGHSGAGRAALLRISGPACAA